MHTGLKTVNLWSGLPCLGTHEYIGESLTAFVEWEGVGVAGGLLLGDLAPGLCQFILM